MLFLLSAAPIGLGCIITSDDVDDTEGSPTTATPTGGETDTPATDGPTTETPTTGMTSGSTGDSTAGPADTTEGPADTTAGETGGEIPEICVAVGDQVGLCYEDPESGTAAALYCAEYIVTLSDNYGMDCVAAWEDYQACLNALSCEDYLDLRLADMMCMAQVDAFAKACPIK